MSNLIIYPSPNINILYNGIFTELRTSDFIFTNNIAAAQLAIDTFVHTCNPSKIYEIELIKHCYIAHSDQDVNGNIITKLIDMHDYEQINKTLDICYFSKDIINISIEELAIFSGVGGKAKLLPYLYYIYPDDHYIVAVLQLANSYIASL